MLLDSILSSIAPHNCVGCGIEGSIMCQTCVIEACIQWPSACFLCNAATVNYATCTRCLRKTRVHHVWWAAELEGSIKAALYAYKFARKREAATVFADMVLDILPHFSPEVVIVPVPTAPGRRRQRGFDHASLIASRIADVRGMLVEQPLRRINNSRQVGVRKRERLTQARGQYRIKNEASLKGRSFLIVDDVLTTGATIVAVAELLRRAGAKKVYAVVVARKALGK